MVQLRDDIVGLDAAILMAPEGVGGERPPRHVHRPARRLPQLQGALPRRPPARVGRVPQLRRQGQLHRGAQLQPDVQDVRRPGRETTRRSRTCGPRPRRASSSTSRTCRRRRARSRRSVSRRSASRSATRSRPATSSSARASSSRWRWSSSCRPTTAPKWFEYWVQERYRWYIDLGIPESMLRIRPHDPDELSHYSAGTSDIEFAYPWGWGELEGIANRTDFDLTQHAKFSGEDLTYFDQENDRALPAVRDRARGRRRPRDARVPARRVRRGRGEGREAHGAAPRPAPRAESGRGAAAVAQREARAAHRRGRRRAAPALHDRRRRRRLDRPALPPPGRGRHAAVRHDRLRLARRRARSPCATATRWNRSGSRSTASSPSSATASALRVSKTMDDYYALLGVDADAPVDDIRAAYRDKQGRGSTRRRPTRAKADAAALNKAWNVLSDPYQRGRYDEQRARAGDGDVDDDDDDDDDDGDDAPVDAAGEPRSDARPTRRRRRATRARARGQRRRPTITLPAGHALPVDHAAGSSRWSSTSSVLIVLVRRAARSSARSSAKSQHPAVVPRVVDSSSKTDIADGATRPRATAKKTQSAADEVEGATTPTTAGRRPERTSTAAKAKVDDAQQAAHDDESEGARADSSSSCRASRSCSRCSCCSVPSLLTGQTLGKRLQQLRVVRRRRLAGRVAAARSAATARSCSPRSLLSTLLRSPVGAADRGVRRRRCGRATRTSRACRTASRRRSSSPTSPSNSQVPARCVGRLHSRKSRSGGPGHAESTSTPSKRAAGTRSSCSAARAPTSPR